MLPALLGLLARSPARATQTQRRTPSPTIHWQPLAAANFLSAALPRPPRTSLNGRGSESSDAHRDGPVTRTANATWKAIDRSGLKHQHYPGTVKLLLTLRCLAGPALSGRSWANPDHRLATCLWASRGFECVAGAKCTATASRIGQFKSRVACTFSALMADVLLTTLASVANWTAEVCSNCEQKGYLPYLASRCVCTAAPL